MIVTSVDGGDTLSATGPRRAWVQTAVMEMVVAPPGISWQTSGRSEWCTRRTVRVWCVAREPANGGGKEKVNRNLLSWFSLCCQALKAPLDSTRRVLVPVARESGAWWGVPPLRSEIGRRTKTDQGSGGDERIGQCGTANLHCGSRRDSGRMSVHDLDRRNWRIHPLLAQLGAMPYNCRIAAGPIVVRALEGNIWRLREALWAQEVRRLRNHLAANAALRLYGE